MSFRLVPKSVTLNDLERRNKWRKGSYYAISPNSVAFRSITQSGWRYADTFCGRNVAQII